MQYSSSFQVTLCDTVKDYCLSMTIKPRAWVLLLSLLVALSAGKDKQVVFTSECSETLELDYRKGYGPDP
jgi:hypothetical protein